MGWDGLFISTGCQVNCLTAALLWTPKNIFSFMNKLIQNMLSLTLQLRCIEQDQHSYCLLQSSLCPFKCKER